ncbi:MAG: BTAD domain-containing putative transcriptional regulator [Aquabacterium sp.]
MNHADAADFEIQILGPLRLLASGATLPLRTRKTMVMLLMLALEGDTSRARLCTLFWPDLDSHSARRNLRRELARLRDAGAGAAVLSEDDRLRAAPGLGSDLLRAEALLGVGQPDAALALWRGSLADGLPDTDDNESGIGPWLAGLRSRALGLRRQCLQASATAAEQRGDLASALVIIQALLRDDGLQEQHHRDAMRLLAATGQRDAALRQFDTCRTLLADELGLQPMPETLALARAVRAGASLTAQPYLAPTALPTLVPGSAAAQQDRAVYLPPQLPFVGREAEVAGMQRAWSRRQPIILVGEAGIGKSRLAVDFAAAQGPFALVRCHAGDRDQPLAAFARAVSVLAGQPADLSAMEPWVAAEMARLLPGVAAVPPPLRNPQDRKRFDEACVRAWMALSTDVFDAVVLDDWQLADTASRAMLARVAARRHAQGGGGAIELLTWRGNADAPDLVTTAEALNADVLTLSPLPEPAVHELVRQLSGVAAPVRFAQRLRSATGGHPFFIAEVLRDLAERSLLHSDADGRWHTPYDSQTEDYRELPLPGSVRDAVLARVRRLGAPTARLLEAAALAGEPFGAVWLAQACALSEVEALAALDLAAQAHLVLAREGGGFAWAHDLARMTLAAALEPTRRRLVHHRLALAAASAGASADAARHFEACGEPTRAALHRLAAGDAAFALHALHEAALHWRQGLEDQPAIAEEAALLARLCEVTWLLGRPDEARDLHARWIGLSLGPLDGESPDAPRHPSITPTARIDGQLRAARYLSQSSQSIAALALLDAMTAPQAPALRLRWGIERVGALHQIGRIDEALAEGQRMLAAAPAATRQRADALATLSTIAHSHGKMQLAVEHADAGLALFTRLGDGNGRARALFYRGAFSLELGRLAAGEADLRASAAMSASHGNVYLQRIALYNLATVYSNQTRPTEALAVAREAWTTLADAPQEETALMFRALFIECHYVDGDWGALWTHLQPAVADVLAGQVPMAMMGVANSAMEPAAALGQWPVVQPLLQALDATLFDDVPVAAEVMLVCTHGAMIMGDLTAAEGWLRRVLSADRLENPRVRCRAELLRAELRQAKGGGSSPLTGLPPDDDPGMNAELRLRALTLRCRAAGGPDAALRAQALAALDDPSAHAGAALALARAIGGRPYTRHRQRLAASLADWPAVQRSFLATWR